MALYQPQQPINLQQQRGQHSPWLQLAFRPLFMAAALLAVLAIAGWLLLLAGGINWYQPYPMTLWHSHEMLFGFAGAVICGFLLTAGQNWTNVPGPTGWPLLVIMGCWLMARIALLLPLPVLVGLNNRWLLTPSLLFASLASTAYWLLVIFYFSRMVLPSRNRRNYIFIALLSLLMLADLCMLTLSSQLAWYQLATVASAALLLMTVVITIIAGRVLPFFTARGLQIPQQKTPTWLDHSLLSLSLLAVPIYLSQQWWSWHQYSGWIFAILAVGHGSRSALWYRQGIWRVPLLWSLHLSYAALALGFALLSASYWQTNISQKDALHLLTIGAMAGLILSMMSRVSLGHTGRPLQPNPMMSLAFGLLICSALVRALAGILLQLLPSTWHWPWLSSGVLWIIAFAVFCRCYWPVLSKPRIDGLRG